MNRQAAFHQPMHLPCGHDAEAIMHLKEVDVFRSEGTDIETSFEMESLFDRIEYVGITVVDKKIVCMVCGANIGDSLPFVLQ